MAAPPPPASPVVEGQLDPRKSCFVFVCGRKGTGKSELCKALFRTYPYDRLAIDPTHDLDDLGDDVIDITELPGRFPEPEDGKTRVSLRYLPDPGSPTYEDDLDRAVGLAFFNPHKRCFVLVDEIAEVTTANKTGPHMRRALHQGRHRNLTMAMAGPRSKDVNPLCIAQADYVYVFDLPHPLDRERVAANIGWPPNDFSDAVDTLGEHEYLRYEASTKELTSWPPLPIRQKPARKKPEPWHEREIGGSRV